MLSAPMGDTAGGRLAAAVSDAGGLGLIGVGYADPVWLEAELDLAGDARVGVGFITFGLDQRPASLDIALECRPVAIQLSFGDPRPHVAARSDDTVRTDVFDLVPGRPAWPAGHDGRAVRNDLVDEWTTRRDLDAAGRRFAASSPDDYTVRPLWAGEGLATAGSGADAELDPRDDLSGVICLGPDCESVAAAHWFVVCCGR